MHGAPLIEQTKDTDMKRGNIAAVNLLIAMTAIGLAVALLALALTCMPEHATGEIAPAVIGFAALVAGSWKAAHDDEDAAAEVRDARIA